MTDHCARVRGVDEIQRELTSASKRLRLSVTPESFAKASDEVERLERELMTAKWTEPAYMGVGHLVFQPKKEAKP